MSVNPISSSVVTATPAVDSTDPVSRNRTAPDPVHQSLLTSGDLEVIRAMFGPEMAANAVRVAAGDSNAHSNDFVNILIANRQSGFLPAGVQISGSYLQAMYANYGGPGEVGSPLTAQNLADALEFLRQRRPEGGRIDTPA